MKIIIDISEYDKEWITNGYSIPQELNTDIARKIIEAEPLSGDRTKDDFTDEELELLNIAFKMAGVMAYNLKHNYSFNRNTLYDLKKKLGIYNLVDDYFE